MKSGAATACTARAGRMLRFTVGRANCSDLPLAAPDSPAWGHDSSVELRRDGAAYTLCEGPEPIVSGSAMTTPFRLVIDTGDARILGFGAVAPGRDRNGRRFRLMTRDTLLFGIEGASYTALPFFIARDAHRTLGVLVATTDPLDVAVTDGKVTVTAVGATDDTLVDVIVFRGNLAEIVGDLSSVVGRTFLPPAWALGFHQSRWSYRTAREVLKVARRFRELDLPADAIHLDIHYMDRYRVFTFSPTRFPDPAPMHAALREMGWRTLAIVDPGVSAVDYPVHEALRSGDMLLTRGDGRAYEGRVWPGATVFPDFSQPRVRAAWGHFHEPLLDAGVAGFWNDMNDPVFKVGEVYDPLAEDVHHHGVPHRRLRNLYANDMAEATVAGMRSHRPGARPFVLSRSGFLGIQRHAAIWTGDNHSSWEHLRANLDDVINLGLCGVPISGADVGGFGRGPGKYGVIKPCRPSAELFVRWMELGALMPVFRAHCTLYAPRQEPWSFGRRALDLSRRLLQRRYRMLPLLYRLALEAHEHGLPIVRPLAMHFDVPSGAGADQFLLGDSLLAAPVLKRGATRREIWLPAGRWVDWHTGDVCVGGRTVTVDAPLGTTPMFVRAGAALFLAEPRRNADETLRANLALELSLPPPDAAGRGSLFLDDGSSSSGARFILDVDVFNVSGSLRVRFERKSDSFVPVQRELEIRVPAHYRRAIVDGFPRELAVCNLAGESRQAVLGAVRVPIDAREIVFE